MTDILMLPGMDGTGTLFQPLLTQLKQQDPSINATVVTYPAEPLLDYQALIQFVRTQLPKDIPFVLLGESFSGPIAYAIAANPPPNLRGVIFAATFIKPPRPRLASLAAQLPWRSLKKFKAPVFLTRKYLLGKNASTDLINQFWQIVDTLPPELIAFRLEQIAKLQLPEKPLTLPALYLGGNDDILVPNHNIEPFKHHCKNLTVKCIDGPHFLLQANPNQAAVIIKGFVTQFDERVGTRPTPTMQIS